MFFERNKIGDNNLSNLCGTHIPSTWEYAEQHNQPNAYNVCEVIHLDLDLFYARPRTLLIAGDADECFSCPNRLVINSISFILYYQNRPSRSRQMHKSCLTERRQPKMIKSKWGFCVVICEPHEGCKNSCISAPHHSTSPCLGMIAI